MSIALVKPAPPAATCSSCGAAITWGITVNGKRIPLNLPGERRFALAENGRGEWEAVSHETYISHFATCPHAAHHRTRSTP